MGIVMKTLIERVLRVWWMTALAVIVLCLVGCKTQYVPVETVRTDSVRIVDVRRDSVYVMDSVIVKSKADTVYVTRWRTEYKEALRVDTFLVERIDTLNTIVEVEKKLSKWQQTKMDVGAGVLYAVPILIALFILYRRLKK